MQKYSCKPKSRASLQGNEYHRILTPGSVIMSKYLEEIGILDIYKRAGFRIDAPGCSMCLGISHQKAAPGEVWLSSQNRNFRNRIGKGGICNLASACTVAASSFNMEIIDYDKYMRYVDQVLYKYLTHPSRLPNINIIEPNPVIEQDDVNEVKSGTECGIGVLNYTDVQPGDQIEVFERIERARSI